MSSRFLKQKRSRGRPGDRVNYYNHEYHSLLDHADESEDEGSGKAVSKVPQQFRRAAPQYLEYAVQPEDTLQSIALRYNCSVSQIKQANTILRDNEIFALRTLRVPVPQYSILRDGLAAVHSAHGSHRPDNSKSKTRENISTAILVAIDEQTLNSSIIEEEVEENQSDEGLHNPLLVPMPAPFQPKLDLETEASTQDLSLHPAGDQHINLYDCSGVDGGLSWLGLVLCVLILGFAGPLIYIFFLYERDQERKDHIHD